MSLLNWLKGLFEPKPPQPVPTRDVGRQTVIIKMENGREHTYTFEGRFHQSPFLSDDVTEIMRRFIAGDYPVKIGTHVWIPRDRILSYTVGDREEYIVEMERYGYD